MKRTAIINCNIITPERILRGSGLIIENGKISEVDISLNPDSFAGEIIDGRGLFLSPGFIDIHTHGGGGHDFMDGTPRAFIKSCELHAKHGTTSIVPTTIAGDNDELKGTFDAFWEAKGIKSRGAQMLGMHLEGPYFAREFKGAQDEKYLRNPRPSDYGQIFEWSRGCIVRWSAAPELPGSVEFGRFLRENGIHACAAHTAATYDEMLLAFENGFRTIIHLYSGMSTIVRRDGFRVPGVTESAYLIDGIKAELIADGCHLPPALLKLAYKIKGAENLILVTDSMRGAGMGPGESILGSLQKGQRVIIENGVAYLPDRSAFAGSVCTAERLVRTMYRDAEVPLCDAVKMMTKIPAETVGADDYKGSLTAGKDADLVLFDGEINIKMTIIGGETVYSAADEV